MAALIDQTAAANHPAFQSRVLAAICQIAQNVATESNATANHTARSALATKVSNQPQTYMMPFALMLASQNIDNTSTDVAVINMVSAVWNTEAGGL